MKTFQVREVRDFAESFIDESAVQAVVNWVSDNVQPDDVYDAESVKSHATVAKMEEAIEYVLQEEMADEKSRDEYGGYVLPGDIREMLKAAIA
ncbi:MAG: hypothetical protein GY903_07515 [Fuerstiella sp.]|nr:hypothetical protein [Fuerstiella sp.]